VAPPDLCSSAEVAGRHAPRCIGKFAERCRNAPRDEVTKQAAEKHTEQSENEHGFDKLVIGLVLEARQNPDKGLKLTLVRHHTPVYIREGLGGIRR